MWKAVTYRSVNCAASYLEISPSSCGTTCSSATILSSPSIAMTVWRVPSAGGAACVSSAGVTQSALWGTVESATQNCLCPKCLTPPTVSATLAAQMVNASEVDAYFGGSAFDATYALNCKTGYKASGSFTCAVDATNVYVGKFAVEPTCVPDDCTTGPDTSSVTNLASNNCPTIDATNVVAHNYNCTLTCADGYTPGGGQNFFGCRYGQWGTFEGTGAMPTCVEQDCKADGRPTVENGKVDTACGNKLGAKCEVVCDPGFELSGSKTESICGVETASARRLDAHLLPGAGAAPTWSEVVAECKVTTCAAPKASDFGENLKLTGDAKKLSLDDTREVSCDAGFKLTGSAEIKCSADKEGKGIKFQATGEAPKCEPITCDTPPTVSGGTFADGACKSELGTTCFLSCGSSSRLDGSSSFTCGSDGKYAGSGSCVAATCSAPTVSGGSTDCSGTVEAGATCTITCDGGNEPQGKFVCSGVSAAAEYSETGSCQAGAVKKTQVTQKVEMQVEGNAEEIAQDPAFQNPIRAAMLKQYGVEDKDLVTIFTGVNTRRLQAAAAPGRRLAGTIIIEATVTVEDEAAAAAVAEKMEDTATLETALVEAAAEGGVVVTAVSASKPVQATVYIEEEEEEGTTTTTTGAAASEEESDDGGGNAALIGGVVGGIGGVAIIGIGFYMYSKKNQSQE